MADGDGQTDGAKGGPAAGSGEGAAPDAAEALMQYAQPMLADAHDAEQLQMNLTTAVMCWNAALLPEPERKEIEEGLLTSVAAGQGPEGHVAVLNFFQRMLDRKQELYPGLDTFIAEAKFLPSRKGGLRLGVRVIPNFSAVRKAQAGPPS